MGHGKGKRLGEQVLYPLQGSLVTRWDGACLSFIHSTNMENWNYHNERYGHGSCPQGASSWQGKQLKSNEINTTNRFCGKYHNGDDQGTVMAN